MRRFRVVLLAAFVSVLASWDATAALLTTVAYPTVVSSIPSPTVELGFAARDGSAPYVVWLEDVDSAMPNTLVSAPPATLAALAAELTMTTPGSGFFATSIDGGSQSFANVHLFAAGAVPGTDPNKSGAIVAANVAQLGPGMQGYSIDDITMEFTSWTPRQAGGFDGALVVKIYGVVLPEPAGWVLSIAAFVAAAINAAPHTTLQRTARSRRHVAK